MTPSGWHGQTRPRESIARIHNLSPVDIAAIITQSGPWSVTVRTHLLVKANHRKEAPMKELIEKLKRDIRRLRNDVAPFCSDDGINTLMDIHDELLRTA